MTVFPFVVGCGRSGTTLLRSLLDAHRELAIPYESRFVATLGDPSLGARYQNREGFAVDRFIADLSSQPPLRNWGLTEAEIRDWLHEQRPADYANAVRCLFALYAQRQGKARYGDKTANYVRDMLLLAELFPEARFVHVIRDGRDVALSWLDTGWHFGPRSPEEAALYWRYHVQRGRTSGSSLPGRYREIHYEQLVEDPVTSLTQLCEFLDLSFDPEMLNSFQRADELLEGMPSPDQHRRLRLPPTPGLRNWHHDMTSEGQRVFEEIAGALLRELGYESHQRS
jgi:hypothetical protein